MSTLANPWWLGREDAIARKYPVVRRLDLSGGLAQVQTAIELLAEACDRTQIEAALRVFAANIGTHSIGHMSVFDAGQGVQGVQTVSLGGEAYIQAYMEQDYLPNDALNWRVRQEILPIVWGLQQQRRDATTEERWHHGILRDFGLERGLALSLRGKDSMAVLGIVVQDSEADFLTRLPAVAAACHLFGACLHDALLRLSLLPLARTQAASHGAVLTPRERECLKWAAAGKTAWEIGNILGISERTSIAHTENAKRKLDAKTLPQAVAQALVRGLLTL